MGFVLYNMVSDARAKFVVTQDKSGLDLMHPDTFAHSKCLQDTAGGIYRTQHF